MLTPKMRHDARVELQENYKRLGKDENEVLNDLQITSIELHAVLNMRDPDPSYVWMVRDYLEDKLLEEGKEVYPFSYMADHSANKWFHYDTPWRK